MNVELDEDEADLLNFALGLALGALVSMDSRRVANQVIALVNKLNPGTYQYKPFKLEE